MYKWMRKVFLVLALVGLIGCGGGGGTPNSDPNTISPTVKLADNVVVQDNIAIIKSIKSTNELDGEIIFDDGETVPPEWAKGKIVIFPKSDATSNGMAIKIKEIQEENGIAKVSYSTPSIDELFSSVSSKSSSKLTTSMVKSFQGMNGIKMSASLSQQVPSPSRKVILAAGNESQVEEIDEKELEWLPDFGAFEGEIKGKNGDFISSLNFAIDKTVIVQTKDKSQKITFSGGFKFEDISIEHELTLEEDIFGKPDLDTFKAGVQINYKEIINLSLDGNIDLINASLAKAPGLKDHFSCTNGNKLGWKPNDYLEVDISGANWPKSDVCLGAVSISLAGITAKEGNGGLVNLNPSIDLYDVMKKM